MSIPILKLSDGVYLDGNKIEGIKAINIDSSVSKVSEVTLKFFCQIEGVDYIDKTTESTDAYKITTGTLPADAITTDGQLDWEVMKERMLERTMLIEEKRKVNEDSVDQEVLSELKEIKTLIKDYTEGAAERDYKMAQLNVCAFNHHQKMPKFCQKKSKNSDITIPLAIDGKRIGELSAALISEIEKIGTIEL
ncbi:hypothetical protein SAMN04487821_1466 [Enterococcus malodoratus]|uniref:hypothetical protein n=1 Tax=Enterococcus malodoratus TaxID=71451 RepID=UPI0008B588C4|nr:hypothetical protein [Enterococcus malodoratus]SEU00736.1 hypothetical protein SAMN04487821_1466 [Enterococcus malodoratus]